MVQPHTARAGARDILAGRSDASKSWRKRRIHLTEIVLLSKAAIHKFGKSKLKTPGSSLDALDFDIVFQPVY